MMFVALLRAVNVGGKNRIPMAELRDSLEAAGYAGVRTYVQSGNVVFGPAAGGTAGEPAEHAAALHDLIEREFGCDVGVLVFTAEKLAQLAAANPFLAGGRAAGGETASPGQKSLHVTFLERPVEQASFGGLSLPAEPGEAAVLVAGESDLAGRGIYLQLPHGYGRTRLNNAYFERALKTAATTRNWRTVLALVDMSEGDA